MANKTDKKKVANRLYIGPDGKEADEETAIGVRYESLDETGKVVRTTEVADVSKIDPRGLQLLALFGLKTWVGNLYNQVLNGEGSMTFDDIDSRLALVVEKGEWPERQGVGGPRYDADALALAIAQAKGQTDPAPFAKRIAEEKGYGAMALKVAAVLDKYNAITGKGGDLAAL